MTGQRNWSDKHLQQNRVKTCTFDLWASINHESLALFNINDLITEKHVDVFLRRWQIEFAFTEGLRWETLELCCNQTNNQPLVGTSQLAVFPFPVNILRYFKHSCRRPEMFDRLNHHRTSACRSSRTHA